jgi:hypothetical protein
MAIIYVIGRLIRDGGAKKMAIEVDKEFTWQDVEFSRLQHYRAADTSTTILIPGYKFIHYRATVLQKM